MEARLIRFRQATVDDAPELARILTEANQATFRGLVPGKCLASPTREESETNWRRALSAGGLSGAKFLIVCERAVAEHTGAEGESNHFVQLVKIGQE